MKKKKILIGAAVHAVLILLALIQVLPICLVIINSFKTHREIMANPLKIPVSLNLENYAEAWKYGKFANGFKNSLLLCICTILIVLFCSTIAAYALSGKRMKHSGIVIIYFMMSMTVPTQMFLFPLYAAYAKLHLIGNIVALSFILGATNMPLAVFLMRTFFMKVPSELVEAAQMDGASVGQIIRKVMMPIVSPGMITVSILVGLSSWNEFMLSSTFLQGERNFTAVLSFLALKGMETTDMGLMMAGASILVIPIILIFISLQRYFVDGMVGGAVKG